MAEVTFCEECNNILYARSDRKNKKLIYICKGCEFISHKKNEEHNVVTRINYNYNRKEDIYIYPETKNDPTLGRVRDWTCKQCGNNEAVFLQLPEKISYNPMALIYVCTDKNCQYWEKEIQQLNDDLLYKSDESSDFSEKDDSKIHTKEDSITDEVDGEKKTIGNNDINKKNRKKLRKRKDEKEEEKEEEEKEKEENQLKQELYKILNINEKEYNEEIKLKNENLDDINVDEYFCE